MPEDKEKKEFFSCPNKQLTVSAQTKNGFYGKFI